MSEYIVFGKTAGNRARPLGKPLG